MKLHLPNGLRKAVMACMAAISTLTTTIGTGIITGGAVTYMLAAVPQAEASYVWNGGMGNKTADDWKTESNWTADGSTWNATGTGPGTTNSNMWDEIVLTGNGSADSLVFGAADSRVVQEGWNPKFNLSGGATLYAQYKKLQGGDNWIKVNNNSVLDAMLGGTGSDGNDGGTITVDVGAGSDFTLRLAKNMGGDGITINLNDATATAAVVSGDGNAHTMNKLTLSAVLANSGGELATHKMNFTLGDNITSGSIAYAFADLVAADEEITAENAAEHAGEYWVSDDYTVYYVHATGAFVVSENRSIAWNQTGTRGYTVESGVTLSIDNGSGGTGSAVAGQSYGYGDIEVEAGGTLKFQAWGAGASDVHDITLGSTRPIISSDITLNDATMHFEDGSYEFSGTLNISGESTLKSLWSKGYVFHKLVSEEDAVLNLQVESHGWAKSVEYAFVNAGDYSGEINLNNAFDATVYLVLGNAEALGNGTATVNTGARGDKNIISVNTAIVNLAGVTGNGKIELCERSGNAGVSAATVNLAAATGDFNGTVAEGITLKVLGGTQGITGGTYNGVVEVGADAALKVSGSITLAHAVVNAGKVDVSGVTGLVLGSAITDAGVITDKVTTYTIINGGTVTGLETMDSDTLKGAIVSDALKQLGTEWSFANGVLTITKTAEDLTWSGGALELADGSTLDDAGVYDLGDNITFKTADAVVSLGSEIDVPELTVESDIKVEVDGAYKITVGALTTEGEFSLGGTGHSLGAVTGGGILTVTPGVAATLGEVIGDAATLGCATVKISGEGTELTVDSRLDSRTVVIDGATVQSADAYFEGDVTLDNGGVLVASGQTELFKWWVDQNISVLNGSELQLGTVRMTLEGNDVMNLKEGKVTGDGDGNALLDMCQNSNIINSSGISAVEGTVRVTNNNTAQFNVTEGTLTINEIKGRDGQEAFTKNGEGELLVKALTNLGGLVTVNAGTYTIEAAEYTVNLEKLTVAEGATLKLATTGTTSCEGTLTVGGNLTLDCALAITGSLTTTGETAYTDGADGYVEADMVLAAAGGTLTMSDGVTITYNGEAVTDYTVADNSVVAALTDKTVYYVNSAAYEYSATKIDASSTISIAETGELVIKTTGNSIAAIEGAEGSRLTLAAGGAATLADMVGSATLSNDLSVIDDNNTQLTNVGTSLQGKSIEIAEGSSLTIDSQRGLYGDTLVKGDLIFNGGDAIYYGDYSDRNYDAFTIEIDGGTLTTNGVRETVQNKVTIKLNNGTITGTGDSYGALDFMDSNTMYVSGTSTIDSPVRVRDGATLSVEVAENGKLTFGGTSNSSPGAVKFTGVGETLLSGALQHTGGTTVEGVLSLADGAAFGSTTVTVAAGGTLTLGAATAPLSMTAATLQLSNNAILRMAALSADATPLTLKEIKLDADAGSVYIDTNGLEIVAGTYNIIGGAGLDADRFALYGANAGKYVATYALNGDVLQMTLAVNEKALVWTGATDDNVWDGSATNMPWDKLDGTAAAFADTAVVNFTPDTPEDERTVTIEDIVAPADAYVAGTGWEWTGVGNINCAGTLTVGDGTAETELTISTTGTKTFTGGVTLNEGGTLVVENLDGWSGKVSGAGTLELNVGKTVDYGTIGNMVVQGADALSTLSVAAGTVTEITGSGQMTTIAAIDTIIINDGAQFANRLTGQTIGSGQKLYLAGAGAAEYSGVTYHAALSFGIDCKSNAQMIMAHDVILTDDATVYVFDASGRNGVLGGTITSNGNTFTKTGGGLLAICNALTDEFNFNVEAGRLNFDGSKVAGTGSVTLAANTTLCVKNYEPVFTSVTMGEGSVFELSGADAQTVGTLTMANGAKVQMDNSPMEVDELVVDGAVELVVYTPLDAASRTINIHNVSGSGTIKFTRDAETRGYTQPLVLDGANEFSGNWHLAMFNKLVVAHEDALANATVELDYRHATDAAREASLHLATETVKLKGLQGSIGTVDAGAVTSCELQFNTAGGDYSYGGNFDVSNKVNIVKNGAGSQSFTTTTNVAGNITVNEGTLKLSTAQSSAGREISIAGGATLGTALTLNGGTLSLDTTGATAVSLGDNSLTLTVGTMLNLTVLGTEVTGTQITLLGGISEMKNVIVGENGSLGLLGDSFTLGVITDKSVSVDTPAVADAGAVDAWADRLGRSELFYDEENGLLYLSLASNILAADPLYWDPADAAGNGSWLGNN
ncbi:MAG: hypothetical protein IJY53_00585 [Akkermansia sp.]|nr:hypothetical protein [Akkermansia sp.]